MGQKFRLVAPRAGVFFPRRGHLKEMLFGGRASDFVRLLAVPVRPRNSSSVPELAPSATPPAQSRNDGGAARTSAASPPQEIRVHRHAKRKADGEVPGGRPSKLAEAKSCDPGDGADADTDRSVTISDLPTEVHLLIFDHVEFIEDVICLGLASQYFWTLARDYVHDYYASFLGRWAGENIVCVGEDVEPDDYPPGLFSAQKLGEFRQARADLHCEDEGLQYVLVNEPFRLSHFASPSVSDMEEVVDVRAESLRIYSHCRDRNKHEDPAFEARRSELLVTESTYFPRDQPWILRNLTTREFVRSEAIALKPRYIRGPDILVLGFGEVVLSRICWSASSSVGINGATNISRGIWAGHRFDITTLARHEGETGGAGWSDVSDEVAKEIAGIWERRRFA